MLVSVMSLKLAELELLFFLLTSKHVKEIFFFFKNDMMANSKG